MKIKKIIFIIFALNIFLCGFLSAFFQVSKNLLVSVKYCNDFYFSYPCPKRFDSARQFLPSSGTIGYISDKPKTYGFDKEAQHKYFYAQYALAPLVIVESSDYKIVLGDFYGSLIQEIYEKKNLKIIRNLGNGVFIFENTGVK